ncbi:SAM-dependent methyltransferase [Allocatelliglobosispora scoriae]|uniref:SAM-dependent methyltransferase n=1 Tax=Allocatelliglobosispora scoriae TaxID=643052 RepID=A0A841BNQ3_9ACTN|nr:class I SAM-dependent methyltransferase [Allocatelliglobosispora scoriae]MBB5868829.1 SAM-dependent methyltransferase [Allocatelliglobosispora scoriae]
MTQDVWVLGDAYEAYVGRWSRRVAVAFLEWLDVPADRHWLDVGCGTGALTATILARADPAGVVGLDPADGFLETARGQVTDPRASFMWGDAQCLPMPDHLFDAVVSGLAINFVPEPGLAAAEMARVTAPGGAVAAYVWDYGEGMLMMRHFWDAAVELDPAAAAVVEGSRFPLCHPDPLRELWLGAGLAEVTVEAIVVETRFADFDDYWGPFLGGQGPAPAYAMALPEERRTALRERIRAGLPIAEDGGIPLTARAWAVRGTTPD